MLKCETAKKMEITSSRDSHTTTEYTPLIQQQNVIAYKRRWLMLAIFSLNALLNGMLMVGISPVSSSLASYYNVSVETIQWSTDMFLIVYVILAIFSSFILQKLQVKKTLCLVSVLNAVSTIFHIKSHSSNHFFVFIFGQFPAAVAYTFILQLAPCVSACWFPLRERTSATSLSIFSFFFGNALGFVMTTNIVRNYHMNLELRTLFQSQLAIGVIVLLLTVILYKEKPATPPVFFTESTENFDLSFFSSLKLLVTDRNFIFMGQSYGIYFGLANTLSFLISPLLTTKFPYSHAKVVGWLGFGFLLISYVPTLVFALWIDRFQSYRGTAITMTVLAFATWLLYTLLYLKTTEFVISFGIYIVLGLLALPYTYVGPEHASEIAYPVPESLSTAFITVLGNLYSFVFIFSVGILATSGYLKASCLIIVFLYLISVGFSILSKTNKRRHESLRMPNPVTGSL